MSKSKNLFTADDFKKDGGKKKSTTWIVIAAIVVIAVVAVVIILTKKDKPAEAAISEPAQVEQVVTTPAESAQSAENVVATPAEEVSAAQEATKAEEVKITAQPAPAQQKTVKPAQSAVPTQYTGDVSILNGKTLDEKANIVIRGTFGNNPDRKRALGDAYREIQDRVNEMYHNGEVR